MKRLLTYLTLTGLTACHPAPASPDISVREDAEFLVRNRPGFFVITYQADDLAPLIEPGSVLVISPIHFNKLKPGMVAICRDSGNRLAAYRLAERRGLRWWTAEPGDTSVLTLSPVTAETLEGVVYGAFPANNYYGPKN